MQRSDEELQTRLQALRVPLDPLAQLPQQQDASLPHGEVRTLWHRQDRFHYFRDVFIFFTVDGKLRGRFTNAF